jgi:bacteriocin biosynthesis cyclodehydratase domain-containing protein
MSRSSHRRPTLIPALRRLWRDQHHLQLGTDPLRAVMLELGDPRWARLLDLLDGSRTEAAVLHDAEVHGIARPEASALLGVLRRAGLVLDASALVPSGLPENAPRRLVGEAAALALRGPGTRTDDPITDAGTGPARRRPGHRHPAALLRRRRNAHVLVTGSSQLAVPIAAILAAAGVGHIDPDLTGFARLGDASPFGLLPADVHRPRGIAAAEAVRRVAPDTDLSALGRDNATFAVLVGFAAPAALTALSYAARGLAHLAVTVRDGSVVVGPLVRPGVSPCLNCLDLHRRDRDPTWPTLAAQLSTAPDTADALAATTMLLGAASAAAEVITHLDGGTPLSLGATVEIIGPGEHRRRLWAHHPGCGCLRPPGRPPAP